MNKFIWFVASVIAFALAFLLILSVPFGLLAFNLERVIADPSLVKRIVTDEVVNSDLIPAALEWFSDQRTQELADTGEILAGIDEPNVVALIGMLDQDDWRQIKTEALPDEILADWVSVTVDGIYVWLDTDVRVPPVSWNMVAFKERLNGEHGANCIAIAYANLPPCTQAELDDFQARLAAAPAGAEVQYSLCQFPDPWRTDQYRDYMASFQEVAQNVPDRLVLADDSAQNPDSPEGGPEVLKGQIQLLRRLMSLAWIIPITLVILIIILRVRSLKDARNWVGLPILASGIVSLLPPLTYRWLLTNLLATGVFSETPEPVRQEATRLILRLASEVFHPMLIQAAVILVLALLFIALTLLKRSTPKEQA